MERLTTQQIENLPEWMTIPDYPSYEVNCRAGIIRNVRTLRVRKPSLGNNGYPKVILCEDRRHYTNSVHRLVANAAFGYYNISTVGLLVLHLDETRTNSCIDNLALGTQKENLNFEKAKQRISEATKGEKHYLFGKHHSKETRLKIAEGVKRKLSKRVGAYKDGELIMTFQSAQEAGRNGFNCSAVNSCCRAERNTHKGYEWRFI